MPLTSAARLSAADALSDYLYRRPTFRATGKPSRGPDQSRRPLQLLGDAQDAFRAVHVAGTADKGSVTAFAAAILTAHGLRAGAFSSPHAYTVLERFQLDGSPVAAGVARRHLADVASAVATIEQQDGDRPTFFEVATALAYRVFAEEDVDAFRRRGIAAAAEGDPAVVLVQATQRCGAQSPVVVAGSFQLRAALRDLEPAR